MSKRCCKEAWEEEPAPALGSTAAKERDASDDLLGGFVLLAGVGAGVMALVVFLLWAFVA
jgi:hypothetical protein